MNGIWTWQAVSSDILSFLSLSHCLCPIYSNNSDVEAWISRMNMANPMIVALVARWQSRYWLHDKMNPCFPRGNILTSMSNNDGKYTYKYLYVSQNNPACERVKCHEVPLPYICGTRMSVIITGLGHQQKHCWQQSQTFLLQCFVCATLMDQMTSFKMAAEISRNLAELRVWLSSLRERSCCTAFQASGVGSVYIRWCITF